MLTSPKYSYSLGIGLVLVIFIFKPFYLQLIQSKVFVTVNNAINGLASIISHLIVKHLLMSFFTTIIKNFQILITNSCHTIIFGLNVTTKPKFCLISDEHLSLEFQIDSIASKINKTPGLIKRFRNKLSLIYDEINLYGTYLQ